MVPEYGRQIWHREAAKLYGSASAMEAASQLSSLFSIKITRNAVIGYWHRLKAHHALHGEPLPSLKGKQTERRLRRPAALAPTKPVRKIASRIIRSPVVRDRSTTKIAAPPREPFSALTDAGSLPGPDALSFFDMPLAGRCRFPYGDPSDLETFRFCGAESSSETYCAAHRKLRHVRPAPKSQKPKKTALWSFRAKTCEAV